MNLRLLVVVHVAEHIVCHVTREGLHSAACVDEERALAHPDDTSVNSRSRVGRNEAAGRAYALKAVYEGRALIGSAVSVLVGQDQRLPACAKPLEDHAVRLDLDVASLVRRGRRPCVVVLTV